MDHTTFVLVMCFGPGALVKNFPKREAFAITNDPNACLRNHVGIRVTTPLLGLVLASRSTPLFTFYGTVRARPCFTFVSCANSLLQRLDLNVASDLVHPIRRSNRSRLYVY